MIGSHNTTVTVFNENNIEAIEVIKKMIEKEPDEFQNYCLACGSLLDAKSGKKNDIIKDHLYKVMMKETAKNKGKYGVGKTIIQFLQQEIDNLS